MPLLQDHLWLLVLGGLLMNVAIGRFSMRHLVADGALTAHEANRFCVQAALVLVLMCGLLEVATLMSGISAFCQPILPLTDRRLWPFHGVAVLFQASLLYWVWIRGGDRVLATVGPAFMSRSPRGKRYTPRQARIAVTAFLILTWCGQVAFRVSGAVPSAADYALCADNERARERAAAGGTDGHEAAP